MSDVFDPKDAVVDPKAAHKAVKEIKNALKAFAKGEKNAIKEAIRYLSPAQRDALMQKLTREKAAADQPPVDGGPVLSFAQEREWFRDRMFPEVAHNIAGALRLDGPLSMEALSSTFDAIVRRHDALRARITAPVGQPVLTIAEPAPITIDVIETSEAGWRELYAREMTRGFDLERDVLLRATLLRLAPQRHILLLTLHHIAADGWSIGVVMQELAALYTGASLPPLPMQYAGFARWQRERMEGDATRAGLEYWQKQLAGLSPVLELTPDRLLHGDENSERDHEAATTVARIEKALRLELEELSRREDTTLFVTLLTAFMVLMSRCTGRDDVLVGSPVSGRTHVDAEKLVGLFLNTLPLRARLTPAMTFAEALAIVRKSVLEALEHAEVPVERIVQTLDSERGRNVHPLYETIFNFTPSAPRYATWGELRVTLEDPPALIEEFSTQLFVTDAGGVLELDLRYRARRYDNERMACFLEQYVAVLQQIAADAGRTIASLDLASPRSRAIIPDPTLPLETPAQVHVPDAIDAWIARAPDAIALQQGDETLTYAAFGSRIASLVRELEAHGFERGDVVAVTGPRSIDVIVAMAAVLRAGGVLLTLSPDLPEQRHRTMLEEAGATHVIPSGVEGSGREGPRITRIEPHQPGSRLGARRRAPQTWPRALPGGAWEHGATRPRRRPLQMRALERPPSRPRSAHALLFLRAKPGAMFVGRAFARRARMLAGHRLFTRGLRGSPARDDKTAYIFFTSGSTGTPKGILGTHDGLGHWLAWQRETFHVGPGDRCAQLTGLSFDVVLRDVFLPLTSGATLVLPAAGDTDTLRWMERERITMTHTVPAVADAWLASRPDDVTLGSLRCVFFAGEPLTSSLVARWRAAFPGAIVNLYGPTETTLAKCFYVVPGHPPAGVQPLGRTLPQTQALVLTPDRALCGVGEPGEIAIRTPFRSRGYINAADENTKRFIRSPFSDDILYLTGDRGVYGADGMLRFLGRIDHQVKVRGVRVEPMEIAAVLQTAPTVATCAVVHRDEMLVAYVVLEKNARENVGALQEHLGRRLPAVMIPQAFVFLDALPLTANQKLDRDRLPAPPMQRPNEARYVVPRDAVELTLVQIWEDLLDVRPIGVTDRFFDVGGHSLLALRLLVEVERRLGRKVPLPALFEEPTIEHLAKVVRRNDEAWPLMVTLRAGTSPRKLFLVHPGGGTLLNYVHLIRHLPAAIPIHGIQARGLDGLREPHTAIASMATDYIEEIRRVQPEGPYLLAGHSLGGVIAFEIARQLGDEVAFLGLFDSAVPAHRQDAPDDERREDALRLATMAEGIGRFLGERIDVSADALSPLTADQQIEAVVKALERTRALPPGDEQKLIRNFLAVSRAHVRAHRAYVPSPVAAPITLFRVEAPDPSDYPSSDAAVLREEALGWMGLSTKNVRVVRTAGNHITMLSAAHAGQLAGLLVEAMEARDA